MATDIFSIWHGSHLNKEFFYVIKVLLPRQKTFLFQPYREKQVFGFEKTIFPNDLDNSYKREIDNFINDNSNYTNSQRTHPKLDLKKGKWTI